MLVYHLEIKVTLGLENFHNSGVYSSLEKAKKVGINKLEKATKNVYDLYKVKDNVVELEDILSIDRCDYEFTITELDPERADNITLTTNYLKEEPTHKKYVFKYNGELEYTEIIYSNKQEEIIDTIHMTEEDTFEGAGTKFKVGDLVKRTAGSFKEKIFIIAETPKREEGQKYFDNVYLVVNTYDNGLIYRRMKENELTNVNIELDKDSKMSILQKIIKKEIAVDEEELKQIKTGKIDLLNYIN